MSSALAQRHIDFNHDWHIEGQKKAVTLPHAWNEDYAFKVQIKQLPDSVMWYRKEFKLTKDQIRGKKVFVEFEGVRQAGEFFINGHRLGLHENGVMAVGWDLTPYVKAGKNLIEVRTDNDWRYKEQATGSGFQWNSNNFNANYGGLNKRVWLHITPEVYQTLPLYSNLGTTGTYVYATNMDIKAGTATLNVETEVKNESDVAKNLRLKVMLPKSIETFLKGSSKGHEALNVLLLATKRGLSLQRSFFQGEFKGSSRDDSLESIETIETIETILPGSTKILKTSIPVSGIDWWSWGHGSLYDIQSLLVDDEGQVFDSVTIRTGFRKTKFADGKIWLNDRVLMMKGYAQRTSNEWPAVGTNIPEWLSDYSNDLMIESGANLVRWMHVTPSKQDIESCDRVGLIEAMPAGDAEKDIIGRQWEQRTELMRDAIIYNRNNPSILFYEGGNESISREHMLELKAIRDQYDPHGGRAIGSREMLDINEAEYGGEMLYINKSKKHPMWAMEYCRDEGLRKNWDNWSYPYHKEGTGPLYRNQPSEAWHHNQDQLAVEWVRRWYDYYRERPGTGTRVSSGGVKIIFSDTNTHERGSVNYRTSGVTDAMRIPKDGFYAHQVMWNGWVNSGKSEFDDGDPENRYQTYIIGHWNYYEASDDATSLTRNGKEDFEKPVYVVSNSDSVALFVNGRRQGQGQRQYYFLYTFNNVRWEPGTLEAVSYDRHGNEQSRYNIETTGEPHHLVLTVIHNSLPNVESQGEATMQADGKDLAIIQVEVVDAEGRRCPLDGRMIHFDVKGPAEWRGGIATGREDNYILSRDLPVECGINRAFIRSTEKPGKIVVTASAEDMQPVSITLKSGTPGISGNPGISGYRKLATPQGPSYQQTRIGVEIISASSPTGDGTEWMSYDDNELSEWKAGSEITYTLAEPTAVEDICLKLTGWRNNRYPLEVYADTTLVWKGLTPMSLGYVHLEIEKPVKAKNYTVRISGTSGQSGNAGTKVQEELGGGKASELDQISSGKSPKALRIVEIEFLEGEFKGELKGRMINSKYLNKNK